MVIRPIPLFPVHPLVSFCGEGDRGPGTSDGNLESAELESDSGFKAKLGLLGSTFVFSLVARRLIQPGKRVVMGICEQCRHQLRHSLHMLHR